MDEEWSSSQATGITRALSGVLSLVLEHPKMDIHRVALSIIGFLSVVLLRFLLFHCSPSHGNKPTNLADDDRTIFSNPINKRPTEQPMGIVRTCDLSNNNLVFSFFLPDSVVSIFGFSRRRIAAAAAAAMSAIRIPSE